MLRSRSAGAAAGILLLIPLAACSPADPAADGAVPVSVWHYWDGANADAFDALVDEYNASQDDVVVSTSSVPNADFLTKVRAAATSRTLPDIAIGDLVWVPQIAEMGSLADLSSALPDDRLDDLLPALTDFGTIGGELLSVPVSANNLAYMYNRTVFEQAGLDPDDPPQTWDELLDVGETILERTGLPGYDLFTEAGESGEGLTWNFQVSLWQAGGEFLTEDGSAAAFHTAEGAEALQFWVDLIESGVSPYARWGEFEKGQGGSAQEGSWMVGIWAADPPFDFATAPLPIPADGVAATNLGGEQAMVFAQDDARTQASADFLAWFLEPDQVMSWNQATGMLPVTQSVAQSAEYLAWVDENQPLLRPFIEQMPDARTRPHIASYPAVSLAFAQEIERALAGEVDVETALASAEAAVNDVLAED
ncbi:ABC transporter substrate-binding protein [Microbacterium gilvum]|uniref:ABC transporter substrate-binding protein n=1 Tax=Microbacterium gilvum TaxID=1336204 RepID=A0ABP9AHU0_9MICO